MRARKEICENRRERVEVVVLAKKNEIKGVIYGVYADMSRERN